MFLPCGGDDDVLDAAGDEQEALIVDAAHVAGSQPAVLADRLGGLVGLVPIALEDIGALILDLAFRRDADLRSRNDLADAAVLRIVQKVDRDDARAFGHAVAFQNGDADGLVPFQKVGRDRRCAGRPAPQPVEAEHPAQIAEHHEVPERIGEPGSGRNRIARLQRRRPLHPGLHRLGVGPAADRRGIVGHDGDAAVDLFPHARNAGEDVRRDFADIVEDRFRAFGEVDRRFQPDRREDGDEALQDVTERQEADLLVLGRDGQSQRRSHDRHDDVLVADHRTLGRAGRAGGVDEDRRILRLRLGDLLVEAVGIFLQELAADPVEVVEEDDLLVGEFVQPVTVEDDDLRQSRHLVPHGQKLVELLVILDEQEATVGIVDEILELLGRIGRVNARRDAAHGLDAEIGVDPLLVVFRQDGDHLAPLQAERQQTETDQSGMVVEIGPAIGQPDAEILLAMRDLRPEFLAALAKSFTSVSQPSK